MSGGNCILEQQNLQHGGSAIPTMRDECFTQPPQLELVGHSIVSAFCFYSLINFIAFKLYMLIIV